MSDQALHQQISTLLQQGNLAMAANLLAHAPQDINFNALRALHAEQSGDSASAIKLYAALLQTQPNFPAIELNYARLLAKNHNFAAAIAACRALWHRTGLMPARTLLTDIISNHAIYHASRWDFTTATPAYTAADLTPAAATVLSADPALQKNVAQLWCAQNLPPAPPPLVQAQRAPHQRLRLGYLSNDIHHHATAYLIAELFSLHNRHLFEVFMISYGIDDSSEIRARIKTSAEHFIDLAGMPLPQAASTIKNLQLDILVDLKGHTRGNALPLLVQRLAPVQLHYLGHPGTIGHPSIDYLVADSVVAPTGTDEFYAEKLLRLPHCYQINDRVRPIAPPGPRAAHGLPADKIILCSFNQNHKLTRDTFDLWLDILQARPNTALWLFSNVTGAEENLRAYASIKGLAAERLIIAGPTSNSKHLARYHHADVVLDTFPYTSHTTGSDALWAGVPLVTMAGQTYASRVAASLLTHVGLPQLITTTRDDYVKTILELIDNTPARQQLRAHLNSVRTSCDLFNTPKWVKGWEDMLQHI